MLSQATEYGLRAVVYLAQRNEGLHSADQIGTAIQVAPGYLVKLLQMLVRDGLLDAKRGPGGGFSLTRPASDVSVYDVVRVFEPLPRIERCPMGLDEHCDELCPLHRRLDDAIAEVRGRFENTTIGELIEAGRLPFEADAKEK